MKSWFTVQPVLDLMSTSALILVFLLLIKKLGFEFRLSFHGFNKFEISLEGIDDTVSMDAILASLTNSMAYGTRRFNSAFTRALQ